MSDNDSDVDLDDYNDFDPILDNLLERDEEIDIQNNEDEELIETFSEKQQLTEKDNQTTIDQLAKYSCQSRKIMIVQNDERITSNILQRYEIAQIIAGRARQIEKNTRVFTDCSGLTDPIEMAKKELYDRKCPLFIHRYVGEGYYEEWDPKVMTLSEFS